MFPMTYPAIPHAHAVSLPDLIARFGLEPLPTEGGMFARFYQSEEHLHPDALPERYTAHRRFSTGIYYLVTETSSSLLHRLQTDEIYHFYLGDPVALVMLYPDGAHRVVTLGQDYAAGHVPSFAVPRGVWQGSCMVGKGAWGFMGCTMAPGYEVEDFEMGAREPLLAQYPAARMWVERLTPAAS